MLFRSGEGIAKGVGTLVSLALLCFIVVGLISMVLPQVLNSIIGVINALPGNAEKLSLWIQTVFANNPEEMCIRDRPICAP